MATELGGVIGRSRQPACFVLGAGCSLSSDAPTTSQVHDAISAATRVRFAGLGLRDALHHLPEEEKQDILRPLFTDVHPGTGYTALAGLARQFGILVVNLNWDDALTQACRHAGVRYSTRDLNRVMAEPFDLSEPGLLNVHLHGMIGDECRYGRLETLAFSEEQEQWLLGHGLGGTLVSLGASLTYETDLTRTFARWDTTRSPGRTAASRWFFIRTDDEDVEDPLRRSNVLAQPFTYVRAPDIDFDTCATLIADSALGVRA